MHFLDGNTPENLHVWAILQDFGELIQGVCSGVGNLFLIGKNNISLIFDGVREDDSTGINTKVKNDLDLILGGAVKVALIVGQ